jgi:hypothetical protein
MDGDIIFIFWIVGAMGVIFLIIGISLAVYFMLRHKNCTKKVLATITDITEHTQSEFKTGSDCYQTYKTYIPHYEYEVDGIIYHVTSNIGRPTNKSAGGEQKTKLLYYNPNNPEEFYEPTPYTVFIPVIFIVYGIGSLVTCVVVKFFFY